MLRYINPLPLSSFFFGTLSTDTCGLISVVMSAKEPLYLSSHLSLVPASVHPSGSLRGPCVFLLACIPASSL